MTFGSMLERLLVLGSILILCSLLGFAAITAKRSSQVDVTGSNEIVFGASRAMNNVNALRYAAKQAALHDPELSGDELGNRFSIARSRLQNFKQGELHRIDDDAIKKSVTKIDAIFNRIETIMQLPDCDLACQGTKLLPETHLAKREFIKLQGRGLVVDGQMRRSLDKLNASTIRRIVFYSLALIAFAGIVVLIVALKNRELQKQKLALTESQNRLVEIGLYRAQFLAGMSHEFRTPLNAIKGFSQLILMLKGEMPRERLLEYVADIEKSASDLEDTTNAVLDLSKIDAGSFDLYEKTVDLVKIVSDVQKQFSVGAGASRIVLNTPKTMPVYCDPTAIKRCVQNLISNAQKFSPEDSKIIVKVSNLPAGIQIRVKDFGSGIPARDLRSVWQVYSRSSYTRHSDKQGSGLGLPIIKALIREHGGQSKLESEVGIGTVVTLTLPTTRVRSERNLLQKAA